MAIRQLLRIQEPDLYHDGILNLVLKWDICINVRGDYAKNNDISVK
jgi:hypothetical protein